MMKPNNNPYFLILLTASLASTGMIHAAPIVWSGATDSDFATGTNWIAGTAPVNDLATDIATFIGVPANQPSLATNRSVNGINFTTGGWSLGGAGTLSLGTGGIANIGTNSISQNINVDNAGARSISSAVGGTLNLGNVTTGNGNQNNLTFGTIGNTGTIVLGGGADNNFLSGTIAYGTVVMNKGSIGGTANSGSAINNVTVNSGATLQYGTNTTDRNEGSAGGSGQIYNYATVHGTLDLNGNGTFSDNTSFQRLGGNTTGNVTNSGTGAAQLRLQNNIGDETYYNGRITDGASGSTALLINIGGTQGFTNSDSNFSGGIEIVRGFTRFANDGAMGALPTAATTNVTLNGPNAALMNSNGALEISANRTIAIGAAGGGFKAGWSSNLTVTGAVIGTGSVKIYGDSGTVIFAGINNYTGNTVMENNNSKFTLADGGSMLFQIRENGVSNQITGNNLSTAAVTLNGDFNFDLALAALESGNTWTIVVAANLNETYGETFAVNGFTEDADVWTKADGTNVWTFAESTGQLSLAVIPEPSVALLSTLGLLGMFRRNRR